MDTGALLPPRLLSKKTMAAIAIIARMMPPIIMAIVDPDIGGGAVF